MTFMVEPSVKTNMQYGRDSSFGSAGAYRGWRLESSVREPPGYKKLIIIIVMFYYDLIKWYQSVTWLRIASKIFVAVA